MKSTSIFSSRKNPFLSATHKPTSVADWVNPTVTFVCACDGPIDAAVSARNREKTLEIIVRVSLDICFCYYQAFIFSLLFGLNSPYGDPASRACGALKTDMIARIVVES